MASKLPVSDRSVRKSTVKSSVLWNKECYCTMLKYNSFKKSSKNSNCVKKESFYKSKKVETKSESESNTQLNSHTFKSSENSAHLQTNNQSAYRNEDVGYEGTLCVD